MNQWQRPRQLVLVALVHLFVILAFLSDAWASSPDSTPSLLLSVQEQQEKKKGVENPFKVKKVPGNVAGDRPVKPNQNNAAKAEPTDQGLPKEKPDGSEANPFIEKASGSVDEENPFKPVKPGREADSSSEPNPFVPVVQDKNQSNPKAAAGESNPFVKKAGQNPFRTKSSKTNLKKMPEPTVGNGNQMRKSELLMRVSQAKAKYFEYTQIGTGLPAGTRIVGTIGAKDHSGELMVQADGLEGVQFLDHLGMQSLVPINSNELDEQGILVPPKEHVFAGFNLALDAGQIVGYQPVFARESDKLDLSSPVPGPWLGRKTADVHQSYSDGGEVLGFIIHRRTFQEVIGFGLLVK